MVDMESSSRGTKNNPSVPLKLLVLVSSILVGALLIQTVLLIYRVISLKSNSSSKEELNDGVFITTITTCGFVKGLVINESFAFLGIPYAVPPTGSRRWIKSDTHSRLDQCWNGTTPYESISRRTPCWQYYRNGSYDGDENCLFLDVYTPQVHSYKPESLLDVVVFLKGDSLDGGEGLALSPSAETAKTRNVVFVCVSIRRSVLGFLSLKGLFQRSMSTRTAGNFGVSDFLSALKWVKYNIHHFGGNPDSVTVLGHQSGATILNALLLYGGGKYDSLFHKAWLSGGVFREPVTLETADHENQIFLEETECEDASCLQSRSLEELLEIVPEEWRQFYADLETERENKRHQWIVYDQDILLAPTNLSYDQKKSYPDHWNIPVVAGAPIHTDSSPEIRTLMDWKNKGAFKKYLEGNLQNNAKEIYKRYRNQNTSLLQQFFSLLSDKRTICPMLQTSRRQYKNLVFNYVTSKGDKESLATVGSDISAIFSSSNNYKPHDNTSLSITFEDNMNALFYHFVKTGNILDSLTKENRMKGPILHVNDTIAVMERYGNCDLWEEENDNYYNN